MEIIIPITIYIITITLLAWWMDRPKYSYDNEYISVEFRPQHLGKIEISIDSDTSFTYEVKR